MNTEFRDAFGESVHGWDPQYDDGLTRERTLLAWQRTGMAFTVNAALLAKGFSNSGHAEVGYVVAVLVALFGAVAYYLGQYRFRNRMWFKRLHRARNRSFLTMALVTTAIAVTTVVIEVLD